MAVLANHGSLMIFGIICLTNTCLPIVVGDLSTQSGIEDLDQVKSKHDIPQLSKIDYETNLRQTELEEKSLESEEKDEGIPTLQKRTIRIANVDIDADSVDRLIFMNNNKVDRAIDGLIIRALNDRKPVKAMLANDQVYVDGKKVCDDITKLAETPTYQKTADGTAWHTNLVIGKAMTQSEIDAFEKSWKDFNPNGLTARRWTNEENGSENKEAPRCLLSGFMSFLRSLYGY